MSSKNKNRLEYEHRVNRVIDYVRAHRAEDLSLETLARVAAFSPFHFHRIFKSITGENVNELVQRLRLEWAATALLSRPDAEVLGIALDAGFQSASAFARAFKDRFGMSATEWRAGGGEAWAARQLAISNMGKLESKIGKAAGDADRQDGLRRGTDAPEEPPMNVTVKTLPPARLAYMRHVGPYGAGGPAGSIGDLWQRLMRWAIARDLWTDDRRCVGISQDDPRVTDPDKCRYDAGIVIPAGLAVDTQVNVAELAGGKVAAAKFVGTAAEVGAAWESLYRDWLPQSGFQPDDAACLELYGSDAFDPATGIFRCELCVPLRPL